MSVLERVAFTWVVAWVLISSFIPNAEHYDKLLISAITSLSIAYLYGLHIIFYKKIKTFFSKN